jgi:hypothetical protein
MSQRSERGQDLRALLRLALVLAVLPALALTAGCGLVGSLSPTTAADSMSTSTTGSGIDTSTLDSTAVGTLPGSITGSGASAGSPPLAGLPAPAGSQADIERVCQRFGIRSIRGSLATPEFVRKLESAYARLPAGSCQNLDVVMEATPTDFLQDGTTAWWEPIDASGQSLLFDSSGHFLPENAPLGQAVAGRITYADPSCGVWTLIHEAAHHITALVDAPFGQRLAETLGYRRTGGRDPIDGYAYLTGQFDKSAVPAASFPTEYSKSDAWIGEHLAELVCMQLAANEPDPWVQKIDGFQLDASVQTLLASKFGSGVTAD